MTGKGEGDGKRVIVVLCECEDPRPHCYWCRLRLGQDIWVGVGYITASLFLSRPPPLLDGEVIITTG